MASEWTEKLLGDLIDIKHGFAFKGEFFKDEPPGDILLTPGNFAIGGGFKAEKFKYYNGPVPDEFVLSKGDLIVTMTDLSKEADTLGYPAFVPSSSDGGRYLHNQRIGKVIAKEEHAVDGRYLLYLMCTQEYRHEIVASATGTTVKHTSPERIKRFRFRLPPPAEQRAIAHILGTLDDKIELNRRMNETLEAMARALFKSWFIDFDPVRRNAARARNQPSPGAARHPLPAGEGHYRGGYDFAGLVETARTLRKKQTSAEAIFWELVRDRRFLGLKFRRQHQVGDYVADFYCHEHRLVVELDGGIHSAKRKKDAKRDAWMEAQGMTILRFSNDQLLDDPVTVLSTIARTVLPSPHGRGAEGEGVVEGTTFDHLFPSRFVDSELGEIPEGWKIGTLADFALLNPESWTKETQPDFIRYVDLSNTKWGCIETVTAYARQDAPSRAQRVLRPGDTIVGTVRPGNGSYAFIAEDGLTGSTGFAVLRPRRSDYAELTYLVATASENIEALSHLAGC